MNTKYLFFAIVVLVTLFAAGCKETADEPAINEPQEDAVITLKLNHIYGANPFQLEPQNYTLPGGENLTFTRLAYLMSNFYLLNEQGDTVKLNNHYGVIRVKEGRDTVSMRGVPAGTYTTLGFEIGLDDSVNFGNPNKWGAYDALNPTNHNLYWGWAGGYIFMAIEGRTRVSGKDQLVVYHLAGDEYRNRVEVPLNGNVNYAGGATEWNVSLNVESVMGDPHPFKMAEAGYFSHSGDTSLLNIIRNTRKAFTHE